MVNDKKRAMRIEGRVKILKSYEIGGYMIGVFEGYPSDTGCGLYYFGDPPN
jgi:hypothetical protein